MELNVTELMKSTMVLFAVIDIIGSIPVLMDVKSKAGNIHPGRATIVALGIMLAFLFIGEGIITFLGVDINSFAVAGSFVLFFMSLEMILGVELFKQDASSMKAATIVPVAFPIIAGAGSMTSILSLRAEFDQINIALAILINLAIVFVVLNFLGKLEKLLGEGGIAVLRKVFGIILLSIAVKLFTSNVQHLI
tara:strand:- start:1176 stop:1754 length:579 start_codon:yes stop_codon:yes gene_type:complete